MNNETKNAISSDLETLQSRLRKIEKQEKNLTTYRADAAEMQAQIAKIGKPSYKNSTALDELVRVKQRLELCVEETAEIEESIQGLRQELADSLSPISSRAARLLAPLVEQRFRTIARVIQPLCSTDHEAANVARSTGACRSAYQTMQDINRPQRYDAAQLIPHVRRIVSIFEEALKKDGDLLQFLAPPVREGDVARELAGVATS